MHFNSFKKILLKINDFNLPGHDSLSNMAPPSRIKLLKNKKILSDHKKAAVLMLFYPDNNNNTRMVLILINKYNGVHSNQISFPGGKMEKEDENLELTALRETYEEIGVKSSSINVVNKLSSVYIPPSNFKVQPFVGFSENNLVFKADKKEVSAIITPLFEGLINSKIVKSKVLVNGTTQLVPSYLIDNQVLWGATAMMVYEFIEFYFDVTNS
jgi:8-oxo-dGTP pyrophosphatase MutT (NUDIX family)